MLGPGVQVVPVAAKIPPDFAAVAGNGIDALPDPVTQLGQRDDHILAAESGVPAADFFVEGDQNFAQRKIEDARYDQNWGLSGTPAELSTGGRSSSRRF